MVTMMVMSMAFPQNGYAVRESPASKPRDASFGKTVPDGGWYKA